MGRMKLFALGVRREGMSADDFHDYWRHPHGTWGRNMAGLRGYVQSHQIHTDVLGPEQARYECVAEMWLDNEEDLAGFQQEPVFVKHLAPDAANFVDPEKAIFFATAEEVLTSGPHAHTQLGPADDLWSLDSRPFAVKLLVFFAREGRLEWAAPADQDIGKRLRALRHVRCHALHADSGGYAGVQELWWPTARDFRLGVAARPEALTDLLARAGRSITLLAQAERFL